VLLGLLVDLDLRVLNIAFVHPFSSYWWMVGVVGDVDSGCILGCVLWRWYVLFVFGVSVFNGYVFGCLVII